MRRIALDLGSSALKRLRALELDVRVVPDLARGSARTPAALVDARAREGAARASALAELGRASLADAKRAFGDSDEGPAALALVVGADATDADCAALRSGAASGFASVEVVPAPVALALARDPGEDKAVWLVLDAGHSALHAHVVSWHRLGDRTFPKLERGVLDDRSLGGLALDEALARAAWTPVGAGAHGPSVPAPAELSARGFFELKELAARIRGPLARRVALASGPTDVEVPAADVKVALREFLAQAKSVAASLPKLALEAKATKVLAGGGLFELAAFRARFAQALGSQLEVLDAPLFAAARGALRALEAPPSPRAPSALRLLVRRGAGVAGVELAPAGAPLPARFGPFALEVVLSQDPLELLVLDGDSVLQASLPRRAPKSSFAVEAAWSFESGWRIEPKDGPGAPLVPAAEDRARAARDAIAFKFDEHAEASPLDVAFVFVATQGEGPILSVAVESLLALARRAGEKAQGVRFAAVATGDHPQGAVRPRYTTLVQPFGDLATLERFVRSQEKDPVDGVDAPEALECALVKALELPWRADAEKVVYVLTDVPPHEKGEPPFCSVDWREPAKKLRELGCALVPVLLEGAALAPEIVKRTRAFLDALRPEGSPALSVRSRPQEPLLASVDALAAKRRLDSRAREVLGRVVVVSK